MSEAQDAPYEEILKEVLGDPPKVRTNWARLEGQLVEIACIGSLGFREAEVFAAPDSAVWGRVVGVDPTGIWFEFEEHVLQVHQGPRNTNVLCHFFIPYSHILSVRVQALRKSNLAPTNSSCNYFFPAI